MLDAEYDAAHRGQAEGQRGVHLARRLQAVREDDHREPSLLLLLLLLLLLVSAAAPGVVATVVVSVGIGGGSGAR